MAKPGPKPKPTQVKKLEGNPGKRQLNKTEPKFALSFIHPPEGLTDLAIAEWNRIAPELHKTKLLTVADMAALAAYCQSWADWMEARDHIDSDGMTKVSEKGYLYQSPWVGIANKAMSNFLRIAAEFGLTPSARSRLSIEPEPPQDPEELKANRILD